MYDLKTILVANDTVFALKCFRRQMLPDICSNCSNVAQMRKSDNGVVFKMQNSAPNSKKCSKIAQRNREMPIPIQLRG
jgi:hypothetical protein